MNKNLLIKTDREQLAENLINKGFRKKTIDKFRKSMNQTQIVSQD